MARPIDDPDLPPANKPSQLRRPLRANDPIRLPVEQQDLREG